MVGKAGNSESIPFKREKTSIEKKCLTGRIV